MNHVKFIDLLNGVADKATEKMSEKDKESFKEGFKTATAIFMSGIFDDYFIPAKKDLEKNVEHLIKQLSSEPQTH